MSVLTSIDICTRALVMIGATPITSFADGTTEAITASTLYESTLDDLLNRHRWRFASKQAQLSKLTTPPAARWECAYQLPGEVVTLHTVTIMGEVIPYDRYGDQVWAGEYGDNALIGDYTFRPDEAALPPSFVMALQFQLAALFAVPVGHQEGLSRSFEERAIRHLAVTRNIDSQSQTNKKLRTDLFVKVRRSTGAF